MSTPSTPSSPSMQTIIRYFMQKQLAHRPLLVSMMVAHPLAILVFRFLPALIVADILNRLSTHQFVSGDLWGSFGGQIAWVVALEAIGGIGLWRIVIYFNWKLEAYVVRDIHRQVFEHLSAMSATFHANHFGGSLVSQANKLASAYVRFTDTTIFNVLGLFWGLLFASIILASKAPVFVAALIGFTVLYMVCAVFITRKLRVLNAKEAEAENKQTGVLADMITNVMAVKSFAAGKQEQTHYNEVTEQTRHTTMHLMRASLGREAIFGGIGTTINAVAIIAAVASIVVLDTNIAVVFLVLNYTADILIRLWEFSTQALRQYNRAFGDAESMVRILGIPPAVQDAAQPEPPRITSGHLRFDGMQFTHDAARRQPALFDNFSLDIPAGQKVGLVGHSGSGKTSLTRLLLRFSDIQAGRITIDGQDITHITQTDLRAHIAYVPQEPLLFHRTIRENIAYGKAGATDAEVIDAAKKANAYEFIRTLPDGFETLVGERGVKLSGGQRQRIAIARAIIKDAPLLVLDEATSALDSESERLIQASLQSLMKGRTSIVIAHRLSTIQKMDRILVLDKGVIVEDGSHQQLIAKKGVYSRLWTHQSGGFLEE